jgi:hypothetical protein
MDGYDENNKPLFAILQTRPKNHRKGAYVDDEKVIQNHNSSFSAVEDSIHSISRLYCERPFIKIIVEVSSTQVTEFSHSICSFMPALNVQPERLHYPHAKRPLQNVRDSCKDNVAP